MITLLHQALTPLRNETTARKVRENQDLFGGPGTDTIIVGRGAQSIDGGDGYDTLVMPGLARQYTLNPSFLQLVATESGGGIGLSLSGPDSNFGIINIEAIQFLDGTMQVGSESPAAQVSRLYQALLGRAPDTGGLILWAGLVRRACRF